MKSILAKLPWLKVNKNNNHFIGVALSLEQVVAVHMQLLDENSWKIVDTKVSDFKHETELTSAITETINSFDCDDVPVSVLLSQHMYQVVQIDKPNMSNMEIQQSLPWTIKDLVTFPSDSIIADFIESPIKQNGLDKITVFASNKTAIVPIVNAVSNSSQQLSLLSCQEMSYCDLLDNEDAAHMLVSQNFGEEPSIQIIKNGQLLLTRRLRGFTKLPELPLAQLKLQLLEQFGLELQRSIDFFESQLKQPPIKSLQLNIPNLELPGMIEQLSSFFPVKVIPFKPNIEICQHQARNIQFAIAAVMQAYNGSLNESSH